MSDDPTAPRTGGPASADGGTSRETQFAADSANADDGYGQPPLPGDAFHDIGPRIAELLEYINYYVSAKIDSYKAMARKAGLFAAIGVVGLLALSAFVVMTIVLLCVGVAQGLTALFGGHAWLGNLVTGILFLAILAGVICIGYGRLTRSSRERTKAKYDRRKQQQRAQFGTDVQQRGEKPTAQ